MQKDLKYWNAINQNMKIGPVRFQKIVNNFNDLQHAWQASRSELIKIGLEQNVIEYFLVKRKEIDPDFEMEKLAAEKINIITIKDKRYPQLLKQIYNPPALLYIKGEFTTEDDLALGVVGTRKISGYAKIIAPDIINALCAHKITIISGLALGVDTLAHTTAVNSKSRTIAVLGSGLDKNSIYPYANKYLAENIQENGAVISEYPIGTMPLKQNFPARNRIISGLSRGTLVIEAPESSGALITAKFALEQNREVFAIPGNINSPASIGPNNLIQQGAKLVTNARDILDELNLNMATEFQKNKQVSPDSEDEALILRYITKDPIHIDKLILMTKLPAHELNACLTLMEMKGKIRNIGNLMYVIN